MRVDIYNTERKYDIIYTDPPWEQNKGGLRKSSPNQARELDYQTYSLNEIEEIHKSAFKLGNYYHNVFMWTIDKILFDTEEMMNRLGYTLHARFTWHKENSVAPAFTVRYSHEYLLWFNKKGQMLPPCEEQMDKYITVLMGASTKHSRKPECAYRLLETMFPDTDKLELFARNERDGWDWWENEA